MNFTVAQVAERYAVSSGTVLGWLRSGQLSGFSVGRSLNKRRARWRISESALQHFEQARTPAAPIPRTPRKRHADVVEFYR
jgi:excisionase family DNA binding protein